MIQKHERAGDDEGDGDDRRAVGRVIVIEGEHRLTCRLAVRQLVAASRGFEGSDPSACNGTENPAAWVWPPPPNDAAIEPTSVPSSRERML